MLYLILLHYQRPLSEVEAHLAAHRAYLHHHFRSGHFLLSGRREPRIGGVILARAESQEEVTAWAAEDPFCQAAVANYEILAWMPGLRSADVPPELAPAAQLAGVIEEA